MQLLNVFGYMHNLYLCLCICVYEQFVCIHVYECKSTHHNVHVEVKGHPWISVIFHLVWGRVSEVAANWPWRFWRLLCLHILDLHSSTGITDRYSCTLLIWVLKAQHQLLALGGPVFYPWTIPQVIYFVWKLLLFLFPGMFYYYYV